MEIGNRSNSEDIGGTEMAWKGLDRIILWFGKSYNNKAFLFTNIQISLKYNNIKIFFNIIDPGIPTLSWKHVPAWFSIGQLSFY